ncbi:LLM class flavin-dependent oxidoreductase [Bacillus gobiensis]|uniref:LLM class flavin-dependent oxidoreductase n=1 Tax=Bacillus gobiensis TaxID=1441095 RepID=UPI003D1D9D20
MAKKKRQMILNLFLNNIGHHEAAWRHPAAEIDQLNDFSYYRKIAVKAEEAKFDSIFFADRLAVSKEAVQYSAASRLEPLTLLSAISVVTEKIGLIATVSTSFNEPYNLARKFSSIDHLSKGRAGWNIITSGTDEEARNFNYDKIPDHALRYRRSKEFLEVALKLWDSWEEEALIKDKAAGIYADPDKVHRADHKGEFYQVRGPLNVSRSPQGRPVLVQAGSSKDGKNFSAEFAQAVFTAQQTLEEAQIFYEDVKQRAEGFGRNRDEIKILPGICPVIGNTEEEAKEKEYRLHHLANPDHSLSQLSSRIGFDLSGYPLDGPLPELPETGHIRGHQSRTKLIKDLAQRENLTIRQLLHRLAGGRGHYTISGTAEQIANLLEEWFENGAADGFNIMPQLMGEGLDDFIEKVLPILRQKGLFRENYTGDTLREHYGLGYPASQFSAKDNRRSSIEKVHTSDQIG